MCLSEFDKTMQYIKLKPFVSKVEQKNGHKVKKALYAVAGLYIECVNWLIGIEIKYDLYNPNILSIECLRMEKRLDPELLYLRDCPQEYSTVPLDMEKIPAPKGKDVPINDIKVTQQSSAAINTGLFYSHVYHHTLKCYPKWLLGKSCYLEILNPLLQCLSEFVDLHVYMYLFYFKSSLFSWLWLTSSEISIIFKEYFSY